MQDLHGMSQMDPEDIEVQVVEEEVMDGFGNRTVSNAQLQLQLLVLMILR